MTGPQGQGRRFVDRTVTIVMVVGQVVRLLLGIVIPTSRRRIGITVTSVVVGGRGNKAILLLRWSGWYIGMGCCHRYFTIVVGRGGWWW